MSHVLLRANVAEILIYKQSNISMVHTQPLAQIIAKYKFNATKNLDASEGPKFSYTTKFHVCLLGSYYSQSKQPYITSVLPNLCYSAKLLHT